ncbi:FAD-dependent oxidoreductase [Streptomyces sp. NBC_00201]|uniref:NAD(P)/FAD-dependent oxidoreductase n=1 Tax=unclassified Streptomyces TaxID=2593676 RepID=UPI0022585BE1|nr:MULTISPECIES: FAD-dependent oxidoreductase [unclassified Streptomyces]MCX5250358.1 FAD-dependent oxidoreductase [Streptomyces sp. NBC_00201]MCX5288967.1 FAD-dependent oxidoreductase [Streptomyces sp. NBC_00183]
MSTAGHPQSSPGLPDRIVIVGASAGGLATAEALRRQGYRGSVTLIGDEPHLPYDRPPLSKQFLNGQWQPERLRLRPPAEIDALDLDLRLGNAATDVDRAERTVVLSDGRILPYDALVVATGVRPRRFPGSTGVSGVHVLRTLEDATALKARLARGQRLVVVGAGFIGAEAAAAARRLGIDVTMIEPAPVPLAHAVGEAVGRALTRTHLDHGVDLRTGVTVSEILLHDGRATGVGLADGTVVPADDVVVGIGSHPNVEWLQGSGLRLDDGLVCDQFCQAAPGVHGVGDVARWYNPLFGTTMRIEHRTNAAEQGMAVARNLLNPENPRPFAPVPYFWSDQYDMKIQANGHLRDHDEAVIVDGDLASRRFIAAYRKGDRLTGALSVGMPPKAIRAWRTAIATRQEWSKTLSDAHAA